MIYKNQFNPECITFTDENIIYNTRIFWQELVYWTRVYFNSVFMDIGSADEVYARLYNTPVRYISMLHFVLGRPISERYLQLFNEHNVLMRQLIEAVANGDAEAIDETLALFNRNMEARISLFSEVLPTLDEDVMRDLLSTYAQYEFEEINAYVNQDHSRLIQLYDNLSLQANKIADYFSKGLIDLLTTPRAAHIETNEVFKNQFDLEGCITYDEMNSILSIAMFWIGLVEWFRAYRISIMAGLGQQEELYNRLMQHIIEFGEQLKVFIDEELVDGFIILIQEYIDLIGQLLSARLTDNVEEADRIFQLIIENMNQRAGYLASIFPNLDETQWRNQLYKMNVNLIQMGTAFMTGDYAKNIAIFDALENQAEDMGFYFAQNLFDLAN